MSRFNSRLALLCALPVVSAWGCASSPIPPPPGGPETATVEVPAQPPATSSSEIASVSEVEVPVAPPAQTAPSKGDRLHEVRKGDTLMALARQYYGDASRWRAILAANRDRIEDPNLVHVGQELVIPD